jgi:hypothetical protein
VLTHLNLAEGSNILWRQKILKDQQIKILKTMNEATGRMDLNMFAEAVNLTPNQTIAQVQELATEGFLRKVGGGFGLTEKGRNAIKIFTKVPSEMAFCFYVDVDKPLGFNAGSLEEFYRLVREVCSDSLEFHLYREDFENWLRDVLKDSELTEAFGNLKAAGLKNEELRKALLQTVDGKYGVGELL